MSAVPEYFGSLVFDDRVMKAKLPYDVYVSLKKTMYEGGTLDTAVANAVADAMTQKGYSFVSAQIEMVPQTYQKLEKQEDRDNMEKMLELFEDDDDVQNVWHSLENEEDLPE